MKTENCAGNFQIKKDLQVGKRKQLGETLPVCSIINISDNCETQTRQSIHNFLIHCSFKIFFQRMWLQEHR